MTDTKLNVAIDGTIRFTLTPELKAAYPELMRALSNDLTMDNPEFIMAKRRGRSTYRIPPRLRFYQYDSATGVIALPRGYAQRFLALLDGHGIQYCIEDGRAVYPTMHFRSRIQLRDYQRPAVEAAEEQSCGVVEAPCGSGKTMVGLEIVARYGQPSAWLTHTLDLANQVIERAREFLGLQDGEIGLYGNGSRQIGSKLTVCLIQTLAQSECAFPFDAFGLVILDECQHSPSSTWLPVINRFPAARRYGVTATLKRADGLEVATHLAFGPTIYEIPAEAVKAAGGTVTPKLVIHYTKAHSASWAAYEDACKKAKDAGREKPEFRNYGGMLTELFADTERNDLIISLLATDGPGHYSLVLSDRVAHCQLLCDLLKRRAPGLKSAVIHGGLNKAERQRILDDMRAGKTQALFAVDIAKEGLDIPRLDRLYLVAGGRNEAELTQKVGRAMRPAPGKSDAVVIDLVDGEIGLLKAQYYARRRVYRQLGMIA